MPATSVVQPVSEQPSLTLADYNVEVDLGANLGKVLTLVPDGDPARLPCRLRRDCLLQWSTQTSALGASAWRVEIALGLFAAGLGQDVA